MKIKTLYSRVNLQLAEDMRFELTEACTSPPFQDGALNRSANPPDAILLYIKGLDLSLIFCFFRLESQF